MVSCTCGRRFLTTDALADHQRDRAKFVGATCCKPSPSGPASTSNIMTARVQQPAPAKSVKKKRDKWIAKGRGDRIRTIDSGSLKPTEAAVSSNTGWELICSYNWVHRKQPTIYVPGGAPVWRDIRLPARLPRDSGLQFIDQNAARVPKYPCEAEFRAAEAMRPGFRYNNVDIVTSRNSLRKFLNFCHGRSQQVFRVNLHIVANTLIIERCEKNAKQMIHGSDEPGYGHSFERMFTRSPKALKDSSGHHRVLRYSLGDLNCAVTFEVDACYMDPLEPKPTGRHGIVNGRPALATATSSPSPSSSVHVIPRGAVTPQSITAEIKTRKQPGGAVSKFMPQLWFGRTPYLIAGHYTNGTVNEVKITNLQDRLEDWEKTEANQMALRKMVYLLSELREIVKGTKEKSCIAVCESSARPPALQVFVPKQGRKPLPDDIIEKFWTGATSSA